MTMSVDEVQEPELKEKMNTSGMDSMNSQINSQSKDQIRRVLCKHEEVFAKSAADLGDCSLFE